MPTKQSKKNKRGPKPQKLKASGVNWTDALKHAMSKPKPKTGQEK